jgi:uncharacterized protein
LIIDCHTHLNRYTGDEPPTLAERHERLIAQMDAHGVAHALVISSYDVTPDRPPTHEVMARIADDPRLSMIAAATARMLESGDFGELREALQTGQVKALKLYPGYVPIALSDARTRPVYALAAEFGVPVMIHTGDTFERKAKVRYAHPLEVDEVAVDHREVTFVMAHVGNPWFLEAAEVMYKNENVFGDISGLTVGDFKPRYERFARTKVNEVLAYLNDASKLMFGTDWPIAEFGSYLEFARGLEMTAEEEEGLLWRNAARVFRLEVTDEGTGDGGERYG